MGWGSGLAVTLPAQRADSGDRSARLWADGLAPPPHPGFGDSGHLICPVMGSLVRPGCWWECPPLTSVALLPVNWNKCTRKSESCQGECGRENRFSRLHPNKERRAHPLGEILELSSPISGTMWNVSHMCTLHQDLVNISFSLFRKKPEKSGSGPASRRVVPRGGTPPRERPMRISLRGKSYPEGEHRLGQRQEIPL
jgi:hypothetical protein